MSAAGCNPGDTRPYLASHHERAGRVAAAACARLRSVCAGWPPDRFAALIAAVVRFHERWHVPARRW